MAIALLSQRSRLLGWSVDQRIDHDLATRIINIALLVLTGLAVLRLLAAAARGARWARARHFEKMLQDPARAAAVPPLEAHEKSLRHQFFVARPVLGTVVGLAFLGALWAAPALIPDRDSTDSGSSAPLWLVVAAGAALVAVLFTVLIVWLRRTIHAREVERLSDDRRLASPSSPRLDTPLAPPRPVIAPPVLTVEFVEPMTASSLRYGNAVALDRNVFGSRPWVLLYLRLFENEARLRSFLTGPWRACGYVHVMRAATSVTNDERRRAEHGEDVFINSQERFEAALQAQPDAPLVPGRHELVEVGEGTVKVDDPFGSYPVRALLCHGSFWHVALDNLIERADAIVIDLSAYSRTNVGTGYELQRVVDRFPIERTVLLAEPASDRVFLEAQVRDAWSHMVDGSPNATRAARVVIGTTGSNSGSAIALAAGLQHRLDLASAR